MNAQDFVTPQAREAYAQNMTGVRTAAAGVVPLYGVGQVDTSALAWYKRPAFTIPLGVATGIGIGYAVWGWLMPRIKKNVAKSIRRGQEE